MTLIVSDISKLGIVMVGDSAVTSTNDSVERDVNSKAVKVQYSSKANVGISVWGFASLPGKRLDYWINDFIENSINENDTPESIGNSLSQELNKELEKLSKPWKDIVCGIHIAGFKSDGLPYLYHVHCGHNNEPAHQLELHKDFPDDQKWSEAQFKYLLQFNFIHLRNGYHPLFGPLFDNILNYSRELRAHFNISFPQNDLLSRLDFYKLLVSFVAGVLPVAGLHPGVNNILSSFAFDKNGIIRDERISFREIENDYDDNSSYYF